jgi:hypothetical protein
VDYRQRSAPIATRSAEQIYEQHIKSLPVVDRLLLVELIAHGLEAPHSHDLSPARNLVKLAGLGVEFWPGIDAQTYMDELRGEQDQRP